MSIHSPWELRAQACRQESTGPQKPHWPQSQAIAADISHPRPSECRLVRKPWGGMHDAVSTRAGPLKGTLASLSRPQGRASSSALTLCCGPPLRAATAVLTPGCGRA